MSGYITHIKPDFQRDPAYCTVEIWGMDGSVLMDREEKLRAWPQAKDSAIATQIFSLYGFSSVVVETPIEHDEQVSTIIQRETDMQFLKRLALRNGYECYVEGTTGFFAPPQLKGKPQPLLAVHCGQTETNVNRFSLEMNALTPTNVAMVQVDRLNKNTLEATVDIDPPAGAWQNDCARDCRSGRGSWPGVHQYESHHWHSGNGHPVSGAVSPGRVVYHRGRRD